METKVFTTSKSKEIENSVSCNACKQCSPLGSSIAFKGIRGCVPLIHGSQGCATYIRRYLISHYREPVDIASSNFSEESTIFGGNKNFNVGIQNIIDHYNPEFIGISSTCLSETIGEDVEHLINEFKQIKKYDNVPEMVFASTPSYNGTHADGFHQAVLATIIKLAENTLLSDHVNIFPGFVSPEDLRQLKRIFSDYNLNYVMFPDYSETLDNPIWEEYKRIPEGGTTIPELVSTASARATIEFGLILNKGMLKGRIKSKGTIISSGEFLKNKFNVDYYNIPFPIGINLTDQFFSLLTKITGQKMPEEYQKSRGRLIDSYVDGHKYMKAKRAIIYGDEDMIVSMNSFLQETGIEVVLCASGGESGLLEKTLRVVMQENYKESMKVIEGIDFDSINSLIPELKPDIIIGNSKGYYLSRKYSIPFVRIGFPIHDRMGAQRVKHLCYEGTQNLYDKIVNAIIEKMQDSSVTGYKYM